MTRGYADYINNVNEMIKRLPYYLKKDIFKNLKSIHSQYDKNYSFPFSSDF